MDYERQGNEWMEKGEKKLKSLGWFGNKNEEAAECFERAANQFKLAKAWPAAGGAFVRLAEVSLKLESRHDAASAWVEAAKAWLKCDHRRAVSCLQAAVGLYTDMGRLGMAARQLREIGEVLEREGARAESLPFYEQAADLFGTENSTSEANKCLLRVAQLSAELEAYPRAAALYEGVARTAVENNLLKYSAKGYLLNAGICTLAGGDAAAAREAHARARDIDHSFEGSREDVLLGELLDAVDARDVEAFTQAVQRFDAMTRLDPWKTTLLVRVKRRIVSGEDLGLDEDDLT